MFPYIIAGYMTSTTVGSLIRKQGDCLVNRITAGHRTNTCAVAKAVALHDWRPGGTSWQFTQGMPVRC